LFLCHFNFSLPVSEPKGRVFNISAMASIACPFPSGVVPRYGVGGRGVEHVCIVGGEEPDGVPHLYSRVFFVIFEDYVVIVYYLEVLWVICKPACPEQCSIWTLRVLPGFFKRKEGVLLGGLTGKQSTTNFFFRCRGNSLVKFQRVTLFLPSSWYSMSWQYL
jgi:hypothetical protein